MHKGMWLLLAAVSVTSLSLATFWFGSSYGGGPATTEAVSNADTADSVGEGIKVHGDWELTVSDPDGSNAMVYNFENALAFQGSNALGHLLLPSSDPESQQILAWQINMFNDGSGASSGVCTIFKNDVDHFLIPATLDSNGGGIQLAGNCVIPANLSAIQGNLEIHRVSSRFSTVLGSWATFTRADLQEPIPVSPNQLIMVAVKITFE